MLLEKGLSTTRTKLIHILAIGTHNLGTWNVAPYHIFSDCELDSKICLANYI
jgi:hypothetical protein